MGKLELKIRRSNGDVVRCSREFTPAVENPRDGSGGMPDGGMPEAPSPKNATWGIVIGSQQGSGKRGLEDVPLLMLDVLYKFNTDQNLQKKNWCVLNGESLGKIESGAEGGHRPEALDVVEAVADDDLVPVDVPLDVLLQHRPCLLLGVRPLVPRRLVDPCGWGRIEVWSLQMKK